jgi:hypothetical protein
MEPKSQDRIRKPIASFQEQKTNRKELKTRNQKPGIRNQDPKTRNKKI